MAFLSNLGNIINEQYGYGENSTNSLNTSDRVENFGLLGDFAKKFDKTAERTYIEDGLINNIRPRMREVLFQQPDITIIIKKKMFSSLIENSRLDLLEDKERLFIRAAKKLFQNKCKILSSYERLTKVEQVSRESGQFNTSLVPVVLSDIAQLENAGFNIVSPETRMAIETLRQALAFSSSENFTSWVTSKDTTFVSDLGEGTGAIEITTVTDINTLVSTDFGAGSASFNIEDPYRILTITQKDIDQAISDAQNFFQNSPFGRLTQNELRNLIDALKTRLNTIRVNRAVSPIRFIISPQTLLSKKVRAIFESQGREVKFQYNSGLVGIGGSVEVDPIETDGSVESFSAEELSLFSEIISNIFLLIGLQNTGKSEIREFNQETNYVRNKMRLIFKGKSVIQNMDIVNIFMTTRTTNDSKLTEGFPGYEGSGNYQMGQRINNLIRNINSGIADLSGSKTSSDEVEKAAIVGSDFPTWLWRMFRNNFTKQGAGTAVFVGLVKHARRKYDANSGRHIISVDCKDNCEYFSKSQINIKPALNVFNSALYDPLTPFDVSFDAATGQSVTNITEGSIPPLLPENQRLLETRALKFRTTDFRGQNANQILYKTKKNEVVFGKLRRVLADSDGFVYRWKSGIQSITKIERADPDSGIQGESPIALTSNPFAGQDVMNVLSLLVTGQPYNYNTFLQSALANANDILAYDPAQNTDTHASYIDGLIRELSKRNVIWGNFIPFKSLSVNEEAFAFIRQGQSDLTKRQSRLQALLRERAAKMDERALQTAGLEKDAGDLRPVSNITSSIDKEIARLDLKIEKERDLFSLTESELFSSKTDGTIKIVGDDISFDPGFDEDNGESAITSEQKDLSRQEFRRKINTLTLRRLWKVKGNSDNNLFIVDDQYDKNFDIQAFERRIGPKLELFNSEYITVDTQIKAVAEILGLEVFCDSQGNIRVRPPLYNRMPSSVFYKMFKDRDETGVKVFPDFLETLLFNQVGSITNRIEVVEDEIRLRAIALGVYGTDDPGTDRAIRDFIRGGNSPAPYGPTGFLFLSDPTTGNIPGEMIQAIPSQASPDVREDLSDKNINALEDLSNRALNQSAVVKAFDIVTRVEEVKKRNFTADIVKTSGDLRIKTIRDRLFKKTGVKAKTEQELFSNSRYKRIVGRTSELEALNVIQQISGFVAERQSLVKTLAGVTRNLQEGLLVNQNDDGAKRALTPFLNRKTSLPPMLEHMIEDETLDDIGPGSGNRFIIKQSQIISMEISENPPPYTAVQVNGLFAEGFTDPPTQLNANLSSASGGNFLTSAFAVDYDMWNQYGFISPNSVSAPWASDPVAQCAPFAVSLLNKARKNIFGGSVTINGWNEFYQAGDVVYLEEDDMLFYVNSVSHSFAYSGSLSTTLQLSYGHNPGEYIPTHLDMIGKYLYTAQTFSEQYRSSRFQVDGDDISLGVLIADPSNLTLESLLLGPNGKHNRNVLSKLLYSASGALNPNHLRNSRPILQLRVYTEGGVASELRTAVEHIKTYLISPQKFSTLNEKIIGDSTINNNFRIPSSSVQMKEIDIDNDTETPSGAAWNTVRLIERAGVAGTSNIQDEIFIPSINFNSEEFTSSRQSASILDNILMTNIIDAWVTFESVTDTLEESDQENQAAQEANANVASAKMASRNVRSQSSLENDPDFTDPFGDDAL